jgi:dipeptidase D
MCTSKYGVLKSQTVVVTCMSICVILNPGLSVQVSGLVETSNNVASAKLTNNSFELVSFARSAVDEALEIFRQKLQLLAEDHGARVERGPQLPGWAPNSKSPLLAMVKETFEEVEGFTPEVTAIHAGLECGVFAQKLPGIDMVSFGPDIQGAHAPGERVRLQSVSRFWDLVLKLLSKLSGSETPAERSEL